MTMLIINGNVPCCDCKGDSGIPSLSTNLFNENEVYCFSCSAAMLEEEEVKTDKEEEEPITVRMPQTYPQEILARTGTTYLRLGPKRALRSTIGLSVPIGIY